MFGHGRPRPNSHVRQLDGIDVSFTGIVAPWEPETIPTDEELLRITALAYLRRPEKMTRTAEKKAARKK